MNPSAVSRAQFLSERQESERAARVLGSCRRYSEPWILTEVGHIALLAQNRIFPDWPAHDLL
jgi:hypothetical protein